MNESDTNISLEERRFLFEKEIEEKKIKLQELELEIKKLEVESKIFADKKSLRNISPVTATILVALISFLATAIATYLQGRNTNYLEREKFENNSKQERNKFQSSLIIKALEGQTQDERVKFLNFLTSLKLIEDTSLSNRITSFVINSPDDIPSIPTYNTTSVTDSAIKKINDDLFTTCIINKDAAPQVNKIVEKIIGSRSRYEKVSTVTNVPWQAIALIHWGEAGFDFNTHLHNGDPLSERTVQIPRGRPINGKPPFTWEESAIDCLQFSQISRNQDWTTKGLLTALERYNGLGYRKGFNINTPYLWGGSNHYKKGKFSADGNFDPNAISKQIGVATVLKALEKKGLYTYQNNNTKF